MIASIYISTSNDPYQNIASEYHILKELTGPALYLWVNRPCVIAGKNQNAYAEWNLDCIHKLNILPVRRLSGGGCVYHDLGNLNFSFFDFSGTPNPAFLSIIIDALRTFGIEATLSGRNDLCIGDKKFGGTAYLTEDNKCLLHGTLMVDVNINTLSKVLQPNIKKLENKGISSIQSRVLNLSSISSSISTSSLQDAIMDTFIQEYPNAQIKSVPINAPLSRKLSSREWIYGKYSDDKFIIDFNTTAGFITAHVTIHQGMIQEIKIYTDSLDIYLAQNLEAYLLNKPFEKIEYYLNSRFI